MSIRVLIESPFADLDRQDGWPDEVDFVIHSAAEMLDIARQCVDNQEQLLVFVYDSSKVSFPATLLREHGINVCTVDGRSGPERRDWVVQEFDSGKHDVMITTDVMAAGWLAPARCRTVVHLEIPPVGDSFLPTMLQRETRIGTWDIIVVDGG